MSQSIAEKMENIDGTLVCEATGGKETKVIGHLFLPSRDHSTICRLVQLLADYYEYIDSDLSRDYDMGALKSTFRSLGLVYAGNFRFPFAGDLWVSLVDVIGKNGLVMHARMQTRDLYSFVLTKGFDELYIFQFTRCDTKVLRLYQRCGREDMTVFSEHVENIAREELELTGKAPDIASNPQETLKEMQDVSILNSGFTEANNMKSEIYIIRKKYGRYVVAIERTRDTSRLLNMFIHRVDPGMLCVDPKSCRILQLLRLYASLFR